MDAGCLKSITKKSKRTLIPLLKEVARIKRAPNQGTKARTEYFLTLK